MISASEEDAPPKMAEEALKLRWSVPVGTTLEVCGAAGQVTIRFGFFTVTLDSEMAKKLGSAIVREAEDA